MNKETGEPVAVGAAILPLAETSDTLSRLFREHYRRVLTAAYRITGSLADAEDVAQAVFTRLISSGAVTVDNAGSYLYRAAINGALDFLRRQKAAAIAPLEDVVELASSLSRSPEAELSRKELAAKLRLAIGELPSRAAEMFTLRYLEELGNREIAALLGTSQAVVAVTLHQARSRLKKRLTELERETR